MARVSIPTIAGNLIRQVPRSHLLCLTDDSADDMDHLMPLRRRVQSAVVGDPPYPWERLARRAVGGLTEVGFGEDSESLLVVSHQGRSVIDCATGEQVARDRGEVNDSWYDDVHLRAKGIGPLEGATVQLAGLHGGGLRCRGQGGWWVETLAIDWPEVSVLLVEPWKSVYDASTHFTMLAQESELRACGFSHTGASLVIATNSEVEIFGYQG